MTKKALVLVLFLGTVFSLSVVAASSLARFEGGIGVIPVSSGVGPLTTATVVNRNFVRLTPPAGQPWVIGRLSVDVKLDGRISVDGRGLLLGGGNAIGTSNAVSVRARLFCGPTLTQTTHDSGLVQLDAAGDFRIEDDLFPVPPDPCTTPALLIVNSGGSWFAAGIPKP
jgi:hypothetical protein